RLHELLIWSVSVANSSFDYQMEESANVIGSKSILTDRWIRRCRGKNVCRARLRRRHETWWRCKIASILSQRGVKHLRPIWMISLPRAVIQPTQCALFGTSFARRRHRRKIADNF